MVEKIAEHQHELGRDAVGVIEDFSVLRRCIWRSVESGVDLGGLHGGEVSGFFAKLMQASDWLTETGLEAFDAIVRREMERALGRAAATDLVTGLPDRDQLNRLLLPRAIDVARAVLRGCLRRRRLYRDRRGWEGQARQEGAAHARRGRAGVLAAGVHLRPLRRRRGLRHRARRDRRRRLPVGGAGARAAGGGRADFEVDVGVAEYPAHGKVAGS